MQAGSKLSSPLHVAAEKGHLQVVEYLASNGADVNLPDGYHKHTPIMIASFGGHLDVVKFLLQKTGTSKERALQMAVQGINIYIK